MVMPRRLTTNALLRANAQRKREMRRVGLLPLKQSRDWTHLRVRRSLGTQQLADLLTTLMRARYKRKVEKAVAIHRALINEARRLERLGQPRPKKKRKRKCRSIQKSKKP